MLAQRWATLGQCCRPSVVQAISAAGDSPLSKFLSQMNGGSAEGGYLWYKVFVYIAIYDLEIKLVKSLSVILIDFIFIFYF